jgi:hypothetical protein
MTALNGFNRIAPYYDFLKRVVFGNAMPESQQYFFDRLPAGNILVLGGGSGEILVPLFSAQPRCRVWYVEASSQMLAMTARNTPAPFSSQVTLVHGTEDSIPEDVSFDAVITNFFLDLFAEGPLLAACQKVAARLEDRSLWIVTDFVDGGRWWQRLMLRVMYRFFRMTCRIDAVQLPAWQLQLGRLGFRQMASRAFYGGFICSAVYTKVELSN